jgi:hypothetical protein
MIQRVKKSARSANFHPALILAGLSLTFGWLPGGIAATHMIPEKDVQSYTDGRPAAHYRLEAKDQGIVLRHGDGPSQCDCLDARDIWVWLHAGT